jgi:hypothetical protein
MTTEQQPFIAIPLPRDLSIGTITDLARSANNRFLTINKQLQRLTDGAYLKNGFVPDLGGTIPDGSITTAKLADGAVVGSKILDGIITELKIADAAVTAAKVAANAITAVKIIDGAVITAKLADAGITSVKIADLAITTLKIDNNAVTTTQIANDAISTPKLQANSVVAGKVAADTIGTNELIALSITSGKLQANSVIAGKVAANTIGTAELIALSITAAKIAVGTITANEIAGNTITAAKIAALTITGAEIAAGTISAGKLVANTITAAQIAALTITGNEIAANAITASKILAGTITANEIAGGTITTAKLNFTPVQNTNVVASINASAEGIQISGARISISGSTTFSAGYDPTGKITSGGAAADVNANATTISGGKITANSITAAQITAGTITTSLLNFTPVQNTNVIASINASGEGIQITGSRIAINGSTTFSAGYDPTGKIPVGGATADVNAYGTTIDGSRITTGTITATQISVSSLSALTANLGSVTAGTIDIGSSGNRVQLNSTGIKVGQITIDGTGTQNTIYFSYSYPVTITGGAAAASIIIGPAGSESTWNDASGLNLASGCVFKIGGTQVVRNRSSTVVNSVSPTSNWTSDQGPVTSSINNIRTVLLYHGLC